MDSFFRYNLKAAMKRNDDDDDDASINRALSNRRRREMKILSCRGRRSGRTDGDRGSEEITRKKVFARDEHRTSEHRGLFRNEMVKWASSHPSFPSIFLGPTAAAASCRTPIFDFISRPARPSNSSKVLPDKSPATVIPNSECMGEGEERKA